MLEEDRNDNEFETTILFTANISSTHGLKKI